MKAVYSGNHGRECNTYCRFSEKVKSKFKALNVFVFVFVFLDKFNLLAPSGALIAIPTYRWTRCAGFIIMDASWVRLAITNDDLGTSWALPGDNLGMTWG